MHGTIAYLEAEVLGIERAKTELSVSYIDLYLNDGSQNADDHLFAKCSSEIWFNFLQSRQWYLHRFIWSVCLPRKRCLVRQPYTYSWGIGCMGIGAGGLDVALAIGGEPFFDRSKGYRYQISW